MGWDGKVVHHREGDAGTWRDGETTVAVRRMSGGRCHSEE